MAKRKRWTEEDLNQLQQDLEDRQRSTCTKSTTHCTTRGQRTTRTEKNRSARSQSQSVSKSRSKRTRTVRFEQPDVYKTTNGVNWYKIETEAHRPYTVNGPRQAAANGIYLEMIEVMK